MLVELAHDSNDELRHWGAFAVAKMAEVEPAAPEALVDVLYTFDDDLSRYFACRALVMTRAKGVSAMIAALNHPDRKVPIALVERVCRAEPFEENADVLNAGLVHPDPQVRSATLHQIGYMIFLHGPSAGKGVAESLGKLLLESKDRDIRSSAIYTLLAMKEFAAPAKEGLEHAAVHEPEKHTREYAQKALGQIKQ